MAKKSKRTKLTRGQTRILDAIEKAGPRWTSVARLHLELGYSREFVEKTAEELYWGWQKFGMHRMKLARTFYKGDWWYVKMFVTEEEILKAVAPEDQECACGGQLLTDHELEDGTCNDCRQDEDEEVPHGWTQDGEGCGIAP